MSCKSGFIQRSLAVFSVRVEASPELSNFLNVGSEQGASMRLSALPESELGGKRVSLSGHHWIYPYMSDQRTGWAGGFACKSNIRITLAYSSDMSTGIESSTYQLGYDPRQYHSYASANLVWDLR
jgi:hypothetical protein